MAGSTVLLADGTRKADRAGRTGRHRSRHRSAPGKRENRQVTHTIRTDHDKEFVELTVLTEDGKHSITTTEHHPFWSTTRKAWIDAGDLERGELLRTPERAYAEVRAVRKYDGEQRTFDLTVDTTHTYYVFAGATPILVHNCGDNLDFAHGTTSTHADNIQANGLSGDAARAGAHGGSLNQPGSLFTYRVRPGDNETLSATASFGASRAGPGERPALMIFQMCQCEYDRLSAAGHISTRVTDEVSGRVEHIFSPEAMSSLRLITRLDF